MKPSIEAIICPPRTHCATCRSREGGRKWRAGLPVLLPGGVVDFQCPFGLPFHDNPTPGTEVGAIYRSTPPERIPEGFDPERERRRMQQGGCCGAPSA